MDEPTHDNARDAPRPPWSVDPLTQQHILAIDNDKEFVHMIFAFATNPQYSLAILWDDWVTPRLARIQTESPGVFNGEFLRLSHDVFRGQPHQSLLQAVADAHKRSNGHSVFRGQTLEDLLQTYYPEPQWAVHGLLPEGCHILAGKPKQGKSYLALHMALAVAKNKLCLGEYIVTPGDVLYFSLEDYGKRVQHRVQQLYVPDDAPHTIEFFYTAPKMYNGFAGTLVQTLASRPDVRLVVIDTLRCIREASKEQYNLYQEDSDFMGTLNQCAQNAGTTIIVVHHTRKAKSDDVFEEISGTGGLRGGTSANIVLEATQDDADALLYVEGKDFDKKLVIALKRQADGSWMHAGEGEIYRLRATKKALLKAISMLGDDATPKEIWQASEIKVYSTVKSMLARMASLGEIGRSQRGVYFLIDDGGVEV